MDHGVSYITVVCDDGLDGLLCDHVLFTVRLDKHVTDVGVLDSSLGNLDFRTRVVL